MAELIVKKPSTKVIDTWKMKRWYKIVSPKLFGSNIIGETVAAEDSQLIGRTVNVSLGLVMNDSRKQSTNGIFEIIKIENGTAETEIKKIEIAPSSVRRMIRKGRDRIDMSMICKTKDNIIARIKPLLITRAFAGGSLLTKMRNLADAVIRVEANKITYENLVYDIITGKLQRTIRQRLNKLYPLKSAEIRAIEKSDFAGALPSIPVLPETKEEMIEETEEERIVKKAREPTELQRLAAELTGEKIERKMEAAEQKPDISIKEKKAEKPKEEAKEKKPKAEKKVKFKEEAKE